MFGVQIPNASDGIKRSQSAKKCISILLYIYVYLYLYLHPIVKHLSLCAFTAALEISMILVRVCDPYHFLDPEAGAGAEVSISFRNILGTL